MEPFKSYLNPYMHTYIDIHRYRYIVSFGFIDPDTLRLDTLARIGWANLKLPRKVEENPIQGREICRQMPSFHQEAGIREEDRLDKAKIFVRALVVSRESVGSVSLLCTTESESPVDC